MKPKKSPIKTSEIYSICTGAGKDLILLCFGGRTFKRGVRSVRNLLCIFCSIVFFWSQAYACQKDMGSIQSEEVQELKEANKQLGRTLQCLRGKTYPEDIDLCGVQGLGTLREIETLETCLASQPQANFFSLEQGGRREKKEKMALSIECDKKTILVVFRRHGNEFVVDDISYLTE